MSSSTCPAAATGPPVTTPDGAARRGFARPTVLDGLRGLAAVVGPAEALRLWSASAVAAQAHGQDLTVEQHVRLLGHLAEAAPTAAVRGAAVSQLTRLRAHAVLARTDR